jgi:peptidoglycan/LPS O-acetylase OafA/YrhL
MAPRRSVESRGTPAASQCSPDSGHWHVADFGRTEIIMTDHKPQLDSIRFWAFFGVLIHHTIAGGWIPGSFGVPLFFCLSGFLITRILVEHHRQPGALRAFYARRILRIFPLYYMVNLILLAAGKLDHPVYDFLYLQNIWIARESRWGYSTHFWTLCVEEQFYLLFPIFLSWFPTRHILKALLLGCALCVGSMAVTGAFGAGYPFAFVLLPNSGIYLMVGALFGWLEKSQVSLPIKPRMCFYAGTVLSAGLIHVSTVGLVPPNLGIHYVVLVATALSAIVYGAWHLDSGIAYRVLMFSPLRFLGKISYGLYVYHLFVRHMIFESALAADWSVPTRIGATFAITVFVSYVSWRVFETKFLSLKRNFPYPRKQELPGPVTPREPQGFATKA